MPINDAITDRWLAQVLSKLGNTHSAVAARLRAAQVTGRPGDPCACPIARYVLARVRVHVPSGPVLVTVTDKVFVDIDAPSGDGYRSVSATVPEPVTEFITAFDYDDHEPPCLYGDLIEPGFA
ncbi:hypothetical protein BZB76_5158 [Actinomadura pelletieri DSM 43383]|uniref:Uncharacterized protein n=1 Tax=Actinomadura pelletieri DSM 43383 TaxID=1120940 RepID=A0A495QFI1_9ACTN|nr:hypothetical protein [Actinomadura pelletieri]RKS70682.1 hypothetical protein BZB76_5158 [Actinomadura pelletieri DSM 43383]